MTCDCVNCRAHRARQARQWRAARAARQAELPPEAHGKTSTYVNWGCRCQPCTDANTRYHRNQRHDQMEDSQ